MKPLLYVMLFALMATNVFAAQTKKQITIRIQAQTGDLDETVVYFDQGISPQYILQQDGEKVFGTAAGIPKIYSLTSDNKPCSINGYGTLTSTEVVDLGVVVDSSGAYNIHARLIDNFDSTSIIRLEDRMLGVFTDMRGAPYSAQINTTDPATGRFYLHISTPLTFSTTEAGCANNDGVITINQDPTLTWTDIVLLDKSNNTIASYNNATGQVNFTGLPEADYTLVFNYGTYTVARPIFLNGNYVISKINAVPVNAYVGEKINFSSNSINSTEYLWEFGDGSVIEGVANPEFSYLAGGDYEVTLKSSNGTGCSYTDRINISVSQISGVANTSNYITNIITQRKTLIINMGDIAKPNAELQIYNILGQPVYVSPVNGQQMIVSLDTEPDGYYIVAFKNQGKTDTRKVYIAANQ